MEKICTHCGKVVSRKVHPNTKQPFCNSICYGLWQKGKNFSAQGKPVRERKRCSVDGCESDHFGKGYCRAHYIKIIYSPPKTPTSKTTSKPYKCLQCGKEFLAKHKSPKYCSMKCSGLHRRNPYILKKGYKKILIPTHPRSDKKGYVFEHIVVAEAMLGRALYEKEEVHHKDKNRQNNDKSNLIVCADHKEHMRYHFINSYSKE